MTQPCAKKGVALTLVMVAVLATALLAAITLRFVLSQGKLNRHGIDRIRAYYAAQAGLVYAMEMIRGGGDTAGGDGNDWTPNPVGGAAKVFCFNMPGTCPGINVMTDMDDFLYPVVITVSAFGAPDPAFPTTCSVSADVNYAPVHPY